MPYLDDRKRVNAWIVVLTIPALLFFGVRVLEEANLTGALGALAGGVMLWRGTTFAL